MTDPSFWLKKWEAGETRFHRSSVNPALPEFLPLLPKGKILVPLCGKSLDLLWLCSQGFDVLGVELSPIAAEAFFTENKIECRKEQKGAFTSFKADGIEILCGDFFTLSPAQLEGITSVYDRAALVALPPELRKQYAEVLTRILPKTPQAMLLITYEYSSSEVLGPPFSVPRNEVDSLYRQKFEIKELSRASDGDLTANPRFAGSQAEEAVYLLKSK